MAKGRFISKEICLDKKVNDLSDPWSVVGFTWLITHADCEGRVFGDPAVVRSLLFPRKQEITIEMVEGYIKEWHNAGMIIWYEANGDKYIQFPNFETHQRGLRKDREAPSIIPPFIADKVQSNSGATPEQLPVKLSKVKIRKGKDNKKPPPQKVVEQTQEFLNFFMLKTKLDPPNGSMFSKKWITPLTEMLKVSGNDLDAAKRILLQAIKDSDKSKWTFDTPLGIQSKFNAAAGKQKRKGVSAGTEFNPKDMK